ncbi:MAG: hypothetical protein HN348_26035 [Proteobacteria bacterium]|jgi:small GTP-binding protein|nr:hypothetical protein [Pseudomonadota bacterium]
MKPNEALTVLLAAAAGNPLEPAIERAAEAFLAPRRVALVGRVSSGKSTLINCFVDGKPRQTGLGGVTKETAEVRHEKAILVDTPGIDVVATALTILGPLLEAVDVVIWVVDGLQPLTSSERQVLTASLLPGTPLHIVVSRLDLTDPHEEEPVLARVEKLTAPLKPLSMRRLDLRHLTNPPIELVSHPEWPRRRREALREALFKMQVELGAQKPLFNPDVLRSKVRQTWRREVQAAAEEVIKAINTGDLYMKDHAIRQLSEHATKAIATFRAAPVFAEAPLAPPRMPTFESTESDVWGLVRAAFGGSATAGRGVKAAAARWLAEGDLLIEEWMALVRQKDDPLPRQRRAALEAALAETMGTL